MELRVSLNPEASLIWLIAFPASAGSAALGVESRAFGAEADFSVVVASLFGATGDLSCSSVQAEKTRREAIESVSRICFIIKINNSGLGADLESSKL